MTTRPVEVIMGWGAGGQTGPRGDLTAHTYQDLSTVIVMPTRGLVPARVVDSFMSLMRPPNTKCTQLFIAHEEVGAAYEMALNIILEHPELSKWRFMFTVEEDNLIPPDALLRLQREMLAGEWDVLGGLYWTKGEAGVPQIWGDPDADEFNFWPQRPIESEIVRCNGTGFGCTLVDLDVFRRKMADVPRPWFQTLSGDEGQGQYTQDLRFYALAREHGVDLKVGIDCRVGVGHLDYETGVVW